MSTPSSYTAGQVLTAAELNASFDNKASNDYVEVTGGYIEGVDHIYVTGTAASTSPTTGALTVSGGAGVVGALNVGGGITTAAQLYSSLTADATSTTTGAILTAGGIGVAKSIQVGGSATVAGAINAASASLTTALPITSGGTGAKTASAALTNILGSSVIPISNGGTGSTTASGALTNLGAASLGANTFTGAQTVPVQINVNGTTSYAAAFLSALAGQVKFVQFLTSGSRRWEIGSNGTAESGSNAGSNLYVNAFDDTSNLLSTPLSIARSTGVATFSSRPVFGTATPWDGSNLANPASTTGTLSQFAATTSAQLASVLSDETGSGSAVFGTSPTIVTPAITGGTINGASVGATTASTGSFTTLSASGTVSGAGFSSYLASPPSIGSLVPGAGAFTTLAASGTVSGTGFTSYLASPPAIGGTTAAAGSFTTLQASGNAHVHATNSSAQSIATATQTTLTGWTAGFDSGSNFVASTGVFTAPVAGYYLVNVSVAINNTPVFPAGGQAQVYILKNGANVSTGVWANTSTGSTGSIAGPQVSTMTLVQCAAGDLITTAFYQNTGGTMALSTTHRLDIVRIP